MQDAEAKNLMRYYAAIPGMLRELRREKYELDAAFCPLGGAPADGMPHGSGEQRPAEALAVKIAESGADERLREIGDRIEILEADRAKIRRYLDGMNDRHKRLLHMRYLSGYSWAKIGMLLEAPGDTVRYWHKKALERLGEAVEEEGEAEGLQARASRART